MKRGDRPAGAVAAAPVCDVWFVIRFPRHTFNIIQAPEPAPEPVAATPEPVAPVEAADEDPKLKIKERMAKLGQSALPMQQMQQQQDQLAQQQALLQQQVAKLAVDPPLLFSHDKYSTGASAATTASPATASWYHATWNVSARTGVLLIPFASDFLSLFILVCLGNREQPQRAASWCAWAVGAIRSRDAATYRAAFVTTSTTGCKRSRRSPRSRSQPQPRSA